jgi:hypothetical protein
MFRSPLIEFILVVSLTPGEVQSMLAIDGIGFGYCSLGQAKKEA